MFNEKDKQKNLSLEEIEKFIDEYLHYRSLIDLEGIHDFSQYCQVENDSKQ